MRLFQSKDDWRSYDIKQKMPFRFNKHCLVMFISMVSMLSASHQQKARSFYLHTGCDETKMIKSPKFG